MTINCAICWSVTNADLKVQILQIVWATKVVEVSNSVAFNTFLLKAVHHRLFSDFRVHLMPLAILFCLTDFNALFGLSGTTLTWLHTYLSSCQYSVRAGSSSSDFTDCIAGVPQGSVLGLILFSCYTSAIAILFHYMQCTFNSMSVCRWYSDLYVPHYT